jgi:hypothetical protein
LTARPIAAPSYRAVFWEETLQVQGKRGAFLAAALFFSRREPDLHNPSPVDDKKKGDPFCGAAL